MNLICTLVNIYLLVIFARLLLSWFPITSGSALERVYSVLFSLTEPVLAPVRRVIPPVRIGSAALDLSPLIVFFGVQILLIPIC